MAFGNASPRRQAQQRVPNLLYLLVGVFLGIFGSSFFSLFSVDDPPQQTLYNTALRRPDDDSSATTTTSRYTSSTASSFVKSVSIQNRYSISDTNDEGWNTLHVFYGNTSHITQASQIPNDVFTKKKWFSQLQQDELVSRLLRGKRNGFFVDLAANDAVRISNTYALETHYKWRGLCLEANPVYWSSLAYRPRCQTIAAVVGRTMMQEVSFRFPNRAAPQGGIVGGQFDNQESSRYGEDQLRYTVTLSHIFDRFQVPTVMDYLSLDVEGAEFFVMETFPFDRYRFRLITIERPNEDLCRLLVQNGYRLLKQLKNWGETIWMHESAEGLLDMTALDMDTENYVYSEKE